jgi:hypothetical protein
MMTHEELLSNLDTPREFLGVLYAPDWQRWALRAVVELHKPDGSLCNACSHDTEILETYPCPTIQAIERELG